MEFSKRLKVILALAAVMIAVQVLNSITGNGLEPPRVSRRPFCLSHATWADSVSC